MKGLSRPQIAFVPLSTDPGKIRFFGTLIPALLLLRASPRLFAHHQVAGRLTPRAELEAFIQARSDDAARTNGMFVFVHRWRFGEFDPLAFALAKSFLSQVTRLVRREGYAVTPLDPLSPDVNLPRLAARAGLGDLSPFGLLVHPSFGPRLIITALRTDHPLALVRSQTAPACTDCTACVAHCPQDPLQSGRVELGMCQSCAQCLTQCPVGDRRA